MLWVSIPLAIGTFIVLIYKSAPYGRHRRGGWGKPLPTRLGWLIMEIPSVLLFGFLFIVGGVPKTIPIIIFLLLWEFHYIHRALIYPFRISDRRKIMPISIVAFGMIFNSANAYFNGRYLFELSTEMGGYPQDWLTSPQMIFGGILFIGGLITNLSADDTLRKLRQPGETGYKIPQDGLYRWVSCPNYLGEIVEWTGWAIATWSLPGMNFALWTIANLAPRALSHHKWYAMHFPDYPPQRKALIPKIW